MAKGDKWRTFGVYLTDKGAKRAANRLKKDGFARTSKSKTGGFRVQRLWSPVKGKTDYWGDPLYKPKKK